MKHEYYTGGIVSVGLVLFCISTGSDPLTACYTMLAVDAGCLAFMGVLSTRKGLG